MAEIPDQDSSPDQATSPGPAAGSRARLLFAAGAAIVLGAVVVVVLIAGSDSTKELPEPVEASTECIESWNASKQAVAFGVHNSTAHDYTDVQVTRLEEDGSEASDPESGSCAVIFASSTLDPEPGASGQLLTEGGRWTPLAFRKGFDELRLTELQSDAQQLANADLQTDGTIIAN